MTLNRRTFVQAAAAIASLDAARLAYAADTVKIGYVSPQTGPLAPFGEADKWVIDQMKTNSINAAPISRPGPNPAMNSSPIETSAATPYRIIGMLGGMITPSSALVACNAAAQEVG